MKQANKLLVFLAATFLVAQGALQAKYLQPTWKKDYYAGDMSANGLDPNQLFLSLFGFREFLAGMLWVKADEFFDQGNYDAVLPIIRLCTILNPKEIDVYTTGMWHIAYNFTDEEQRSDRRYIPSALALGKEGYTQNPLTYELYFETGWTWYHKVDDDYDQAVGLFEKAAQHSDIPPARRNLLHAAYQRSGQIGEGLNLLYNLYDAAAVRANRDPGFGNGQNFATIEGNLDNMLVRMVQRGWQAQHSEIGKAEKWYENTAYDTKPPFDVGFSVKATVLEPMVIRFEGTWNVLPVGTRIRVILRDLDYPGAKAGELNWNASDGVSLDPPKTLTFMQDQLYVKNQRFNKKVDMSKDPTMYPLTKEKYLLEFYYNPRSAPPHIQDRFGWDGEGMTDKNFLNTKIRGTPDRPQRVIYTTLELTRDQIKRKGRWYSDVPVVKTSNYVETSTSRTKDDLIKVPALRSSGK